MRATHIAPILPLIAGSALAQPFELRTLIVEGDSLPDGARFEAAAASTLQLADDGSVAMIANLVGGTQVILSDRSGVMQTTARVGQPVEGTDGVFDAFFTLLYAGDRSILFRAGLAGDLIDCNNNGFAENDHALFIDDGDGPRLLLREDDDLPGAEPFRAALIGNLTTSPFTGVFGTHVTTRTGECPNFSENNTIYMIDRGSGLGPFVIPGDPAPLDDTTFGSTAQSLRFNAVDTEEILFAAELAGDGFFEGNDLTLIRDIAGDRTVVLRENEPVPGRPDLTIGPLFRSASLRSDIFTWTADTRRPDGSFASVDALMRLDREENLATLALEGDPAPGIAGATIDFIGLQNFSFFPSTHTIGGADDGATAVRIVISGQGVTPENNEVLYHVDANNNFAIVAREGDHAPGYPQGVTFSIVETFSHRALEKPWMDRAGDVLFVASLRGDGLGGDFDQPRALYFYDAGPESLSKIIGPRDTLDLGGGDVREIESVEILGSTARQSPNFAPLNDAGSLIFAVTLEGGAQAVLLAQRTDACPADLDGDSDADADDFFAYLDLFAADDPVADLDSDGDTDADDFFTYLDLFAQGCD